MNFSEIFKKVTSAFLLVSEIILALFGGAKTPRGQELNLNNFVMTFEDEFDGDSLNTSVWKMQHDGVRRGGYWDIGQAIVKDGTLIIRTEYLEDGKFGPGFYSCGIDTNGRFDQTYGYFETRCILPKGEGVWAAFWMLCDSMNDETMGGLNGAEIDIFESPYYYKKFIRNSVSSCIHIDGYGDAHKSKSLGKWKVNNPYEEYNTYGVEWNENEYIFYINGVETARTNYGGISTVPEYVILSTEVGGKDFWDGVPGESWAGVITNNPDELFPMDFVVDYVRAYQYKDKITP